MAAIAEWEVAFDLITPQGTLLLNREQATGRFQIDKSGSTAGTRVRSSKLNIPQGDGSILRRRFTDGYEVTLKIVYWDTNQQTACTTTDPSSREMNDLLMLHLRSLLNAQESNRLIWTPTGAPDRRMLLDIRLLGEPVITEEDAVTSLSFTLDSPYPYAMDLTEITTSFDSADPDEILDNNGTAPFYPVWKVYGPTCFWSILNVDTNQMIRYDASLPGAQCIETGEYAEIDTFRNTIYLDGDQDNLMAGIDMTVTNFFPLEVGNNEILVDGDGTFPTPDVDVLWQNAWY